MKRKQIFYYIIIVLLLIIFAISAFYVGQYIMDSKKQEERYDNLAAIVENARRETQPDKETTPEGMEDAEEPTEPPILPEYQELHEMNGDMVGWLSIDDTPVNYPVMQTPNSEDYYLRRNFDRKVNVHGCLYAREECDIDTPSDNVTIYGHHMRDGSMFGSLKYFQKKSYWEEHSTLRFDTLTEHHTYQIFAVFKTTATVDEGFPYHQFVNAADEAEFNEFIATCKELSFYDTGITPLYGDKIICLSTCEYTQVNGRFVVAAVRID